MCLPGSARWPFTNVLVLPEVSLSALSEASQPHTRKGAERESKLSKSKGKEAKSVITLITLELAAVIPSSLSIKLNILFDRKAENCSNL